MSDCVIDAVTGARFREVLGWLHHSSPPPETGLSQSGQLLEARGGQETIGAVWVSLMAGRMGSVVGPRIQSADADQVAKQLLERAIRYFLQNGVVLGQALLDADTSERRRWLMAAGFKDSLQIDHLVWPARNLAGAAPISGDLEFQPYVDARHTRMIDVVRKTYEQTEDCPILNGVRRVEDVLEGYRRSGDWSPARWLIVRHGDADIGCLLINDHTRDRQLELVYMGLVPTARGKGWGLAVTRQAQEMTIAAGRERLILGVDASNTPAQAMYHRAGFIRYDTKQVFLRFMNQND